MSYMIPKRIANELGIGLGLMKKLNDGADIQQRMAEIIDQHHQSDEYGYPVEDCRCSDDRDGTETWAAHLALVLTNELGFCRAGSRHTPSSRLK